MSESTTEQAPVTQANAAVTALLEMIKVEITGANSIAQRLNSQGDSKALVAEVRDKTETDDKFLTEYRNALAQLDNKREEFVTKATAYVVENGLVSSDNLSEAQVEAEKVNFKAKQSTIKAYRGALEALPGGKDVEIPAVTSVSGMGRSASASGQKRPRLATITVTDPSGTEHNIVEQVTDTKTKEIKDVVSFTVLSRWFKEKASHKVEVTELQEAAFNAAGSKDLSTAQQAEFVVSVEGKGHYNVTVTPKGSGE